MQIVFYNRQPDWHNYKHGIKRILTMRVSSSYLASMATRSMSGAYDTYFNTMNKILSGKNFTKVSEDVVGATRVLKYNDQLAKLNQFQSNIQAANNEMNFAYDTLDNINEELSRISNLVADAANGTTTPESAKAFATEIEQHVSTILDKMNTKYLDNYIFSGTFVQEQTYTQDEDGNVTYNGSSKAAGDRNLLISENTTFAYNFTGEEIFGSQDDANNFFNEMQDLKKLLNADELDYDAIREKLGVLKKTQDKIIDSQGEISSKVTKLITTQGINEDAILALTENKSDIEDLDLAAAATDLANAQASLQASYLLGTNILNGVSLLDYI